MVRNHIFCLLDILPVAPYHRYFIFSTYQTKHLVSRRVVQCIGIATDLKLRWICKILMCHFWCTPVRDNIRWSILLPARWENNLPQHLQRVWLCHQSRQTLHPFIGRSCKKYAQSTSETTITWAWNEQWDYWRLSKSHARQGGRTLLSQKRGIAWSRPKDLEILSTSLQSYRA